MYKTALATICLILSYCNVYAKYGFLLNKAYAERYLAIDSIFYYNSVLRDNKDALATEVGILRKEAQDANDIELSCESDLVTLANISTNDRSHEYEKVEPLAFALIEKSKKYKLVQIELRCRQFLGRYYMEKAGRYIDAIDQFLASYYLLQQLSIEEFPTKKEHIYNVAHAYYNFGDFEDAQKYMMEAERERMPNNMSMLDDKHKIGTYISLENTLGLIYRNEKKYDSANYYFNKVIELAASRGDSVWIGIATGNIGIGYYLQQKYNEAIPLLQVDIYQSLKAGEWDNGVNSLIKLTDIYLQRKDYKTVRQLMDSARRIVSITMEPSQHMQSLGLIMAKYYSATGNTDLAYKYMDSARVAKDLMDSKKNTKAIALEEQKMELQKHRAELQKTEDDKKLQILRRNSLLAGVVLISSIMLLVFNGQKRSYRQKSKLAEAEKRRAEDELKNATRQLDDFTQSIHEKNTLIEKITADIEKYQAELASTNNGAQSALNNDALLQLQQSILLTDDQWEEFKGNFEKVHIGFLNRLREKLPELTPAETRFMALAKLRLSNKEMAGMLGVSMQGVRNYRYRLRKKLNLPEEGSIDELVEMI